MVNNPLYPGYSPKKKDSGNSNPLYPGYYTGQPLPKRVQPKNYVKPIEFKADVLMEDIDRAGEAVINMPLGPKWVVQRTVDDWKSQLRVTVGGGEMKPTDVDDYSLQEFPGAATTLSLNPEDWGIGKDGVDGEKAKKQFTKTINNWAKQVTGVDFMDLSKSDFSDIQNKTNHVLWARAMGFEEEIANRGGFSRIEEEAIKNIGERTATMYGGTTTGTGTPFSLRNAVGVETTRFGSTVNYNQDKQLYAETAGLVAEFQSQKDNDKMRDSNYLELQKEAIKAANIEIQTEYRRAGTPLSNHPDEVKFFELQAKAVDEIHNLNNKSDGLSDASKTLKNILKNEDKAYEVIAGQRVIKNKEKVLRDLKASLDNSSNVINNVIIQDLQNINLNNIPIDSYNKTLKILNDDYNKYTSKVSGLVDQAINSGSDADIKKLIGYLDGKTLDKSLINREIYMNSVVGELQDVTTFGLISKSNGYIGKIINDPNVIAQADLKARWLSPVLYRASQDRVRFVTQEVLETLDNGNFLERNVWRAAKKVMPKKIADFTGGEFIKERLEKNNYFGLKITPRGTPSQFDPKYAEFVNRHGYKIKINVDPTIIHGGKLEVIGGENFEIFDDSVFVKQFFDRDGNCTDTQLLKELLDFKRRDPVLDFDHTLGLDYLPRKFFNGRGWASLSTDEQQTLKILSEGILNGQSDIDFKNSISRILFGEEFDLLPGLGRESDLKKLNRVLKDVYDNQTLDLKFKLAQKIFGVNRITRWEDLQNLNLDEILKLNGQFEKIGRYGNYLNKLGTSRGITLNPNNKFDLFNKFKLKNESLPPSYGLSKKFIDPLGKINKKMQQAQQWWMNSLGGKILKQYTAFKTFLSEKLAATISKLLAKVFGAAVVATGYLAILLPIIQQVAKFAIEKAIKYAMAAFKAVIKWDTEELRKMFQKDMEKFMKGCAIIACIQILGCIMPPLIFFAIFASVLSPIDVTRRAKDDYSETICNYGYDCEGLDPPEMPKNPPNANTCEIGKTAYDIVNGLERGFWCMFNQPPGEPPGTGADRDFYFDKNKLIWNQAIFNLIGEDACEETVRAQSDLYHVLFWCTWLLEKSFGLNNIPGWEAILDPGANTTKENFILAATKAASWGDNKVLECGYDYVSAAELGPSGGLDVTSIGCGDVIFYSDTGGDATHVAIVYEVTQDYIITVESNAIVKSNTIIVDADGKLTSESMPGLQVLGFGTYRDIGCP